MSAEHLKLAEAYYEVARDLKRHSLNYAAMAENLNKIADTMCEASMRGGKSTPNPGKEP